MVGFEAILEYVDASDLGRWEMTLSLLVDTRIFGISNG